MKKYRLSFVLIVLLISIALLGSFSVESLGAETLDFTFITDDLYNSTNPEYYDSFNVRNATEYTGHYPATYSFENEIGFTNESISYFTDISGTGFTNVEIIDNYLGHDSVVNATYIGGSGNVFHSHLETFTEGSIELWYLQEKGNNYGDIISLDAGEAVWIKIDNGLIKYYDGITLTSSGVSFNTNVWYHIKYTLNCSTDKFALWINNNLIDDSIDFKNPQTEITNTFIMLGIIGNNFFLDAIGYSWDAFGSYTGIYFDTSVEIASPYGITWDGDSFWILDVLDGEVYNYDSDGVYTDIHFDAGIESTEAYGITWDDDSFWILDRVGKEVYNYDSDGVYTDIHFDISAESDNPNNIAWDGDSFWILDLIDKEVYNYDSDGVYTDIHFDVSTESGNPYGITWDNISFWITDIGDDEVYNYDSDGVYTDIHFDTSAESGDPYGITWDNTSFWILDLIDDKVYNYKGTEGYNIGDNIIPYLETNTSIQEVNKWEFSYSDFPTQYVINSDVFSDWDEIDADDKLNIAMDYDSLLGNPTYFPDRKIKFDDHVGSASNIGIEREFDILDGIVNITWNYNITVIDGVSVSEMTTEIYSQDDTLLSQIYCEMGNLEYKNSTGSDVVLENGIITTGEIYDFNYYINFNDNISILSFYIDGVLYDTYFIPFIDSTDIGIGKIAFMCYYDSPRELIYYLDYIGVYSNGTSISTEPAFRQVSLDDSIFHQYWYFDDYFKLTLDLEGLIGIYLTDWYFYAGIGDIEPIVSTIQLDEPTVFNLYDKTYDSENHIYSPLLWIEFYDQFQYHEIVIGGRIQLTDGEGNYYTLEYTYGNIDIQESYFWLDSNNRLQYRLIANDDENEYIKAIFDIDDIPAENRSIRFSSNINGNAYGYFRVNFVDSMIGFEIPYYAKTTVVILPQTKIVDEFRILITDNDLTNNTVCTGYISNIKLIYYPDLQISLETFNLLAIIVPLMILIVPPITMHKKFGTSGVFVMFILMSFVCVATSLIPIWLFFLITLSSIGLLAMKKEVGDKKT